MDIGDGWRMSELEIDDLAGDDFVAELRAHAERLVVTGGRRFDDDLRLEADLLLLSRYGLKRVAQGGHGIDKLKRRPKRSADALAEFFARQLGLDGRTYDADWDRYGRLQAGPIRNVEMLENELRLAQEAGVPLILAAYPDPRSAGTWHCLAEAINRAIGAVAWVPWAASPATVVHTALSRRGIKGRVPMERIGHRVLIPPMSDPFDWLARARAVWQECPV